MKVKVIVPVNNQNDVKPKVKSMLDELSTRFDDIHIMKSQNALPSRARNSGIFGMYTDLKWPKHLLKDYDVYAFLDSDVLPNVDDYERALKGADRNTCATGAYKIRGEEAYALGFLNLPYIASVKSNQPLPEVVDWAAGGLLIIGADILSTIPNPYFHELIISWTDDQGVERSTIVGEDVAFSININRAGNKIKVIRDLVADHLTRDEDEED